MYFRAEAAAARAFGHQGGEDGAEEEGQDGEAEVPGGAEVAAGGGLAEPCGRSGHVGDHRLAGEEGDDVGVAADPAQGDRELRLLVEGIGLC
jgi:hypothetical protein